MARLFSVSCGPLPVLLLLLLASVPIMALPWGSAVEVLGEHSREFFKPAEKLALHALREMKAPEDFIKGVKTGFKTCKTLKKLQGVIEKRNLGPSGTTIAIGIKFPTGGYSTIPILMADITATDHGLCGPKVAVGLPQPGPSSWAVVAFGYGGELSKTFPMFSYQVAADGRAVVRLPTAAPQGNTIPFHTNTNGDGRYYVEVTGIWVGKQVVWTSTELGFRPHGTGGVYVYLSTMVPYTYLENGVYVRLREALRLQIYGLNRGAMPTSLGPTDKLCYKRTYLTWVPPMAILFGGNAVMELRQDNVWYTDQGSDTVCLAILPTTDPSSPDQASVLGSWLQTDRMMTIDVTHEVFQKSTPGSLLYLLRSLTISLRKVDNKRILSGWGFQLSW
nr:unnamed protein product [Digitaria exilis]